MEMERVESRKFCKMKSIFFDLTVKKVKRQLS